ncbi:hypothetical protein AV521_31545 [Streptomyces sp. IMTB 2501]|uniref:hypothetical protein n=1 Tax=Streptomyces sp. IMTB 2501 TaxID=1776340 RepID=UPI00096BF0C4|nr:hypothetical protein [Streptomyces sp. IMTB 2501]OLZ65582.1 hypothetical protein AV521_31545 [Streptomyces sp. IMTB 2501]
MNLGRRRAVVLLATIATFAAALAGVYALTGLWLAHDAANRWAVAVAFAAAASSAVDKALSPWAGHTPSQPPAGPGDDQDDDSGTMPPDADPPDRDPEPFTTRRSRTRDRVTTAVLSVAVTAAVSAVVYGVVTPRSGHSGAAAASATSPVPGTARTSGAGPTPSSDGYTLVYGHRSLSLKNYNYAFDLRAGTVSGSETPWSASTDAGGDGDGAFELQPLTDAYVVPGKTVPSAGQCAAKATHHPAKGWLHFRQVPPGSTFCLRDTRTGDIAVFTVIDVDHGNYATTDDITYYRHQS